MSAESVVWKLVLATYLVLETVVFFLIVRILYNRFLSDSPLHLSFIYFTGHKESQEHREPQQEHKEYEKIKTKEVNIEDIKVAQEKKAAEAKEDDVEVDREREGLTSQGSQGSLRKQETFTVSHWLVFLLFFPILARVIDCIINQEHFISGKFSDQDAAMMAVGSAPGYFFFSSTLLLLSFWRKLCTISYTTKAIFVREMYVFSFCCNLLVYCIWLSLVIAMSTTEGHTEEIHESEAIFASTISLVCFFSFLYLGISLRKKIRSPAFVPTATNSVSQKIGMLTATYTTLFAMRSVYILFWTFIIGKYLSDKNAIMGFNLFFYFGMEIIPISIILYILTRKTPDTHSKSPPLLRQDQNQNHQDIN